MLTKEILPTRGTMPWTTSAQNSHYRCPRVSNFIIFFIFKFNHIQTILLDLLFRYQTLYHFFFFFNFVYFNHTSEWQIQISDFLVKSTPQFLSSYTHSDFISWSLNVEYCWQSLQTVVKYSVCDGSTELFSLLTLRFVFI